MILQIKIYTCTTQKDKTLKTIHKKWNIKWIVLIISVRKRKEQISNNKK